MNHLFRGVFACFLLLPWAGRLAANEDEIRAAIQSYAEAFNAKQLEPVAAMWSEDAIYIDLATGTETVGRQQIAKDIGQAFQERPDERLVGSIETVRLVTPEVAQVRGQTSLSSPASQPQVFDFSGILVKKNGKWLIHSLEEMPAIAPPTSYDALRDLEWLVGKWEDESADSKVITEIRWSPNASFLIRSFALTSDEAVEQQGTQIIGWDPRSRQIRSWAFNSDGSFGDAVWSKNEEDWLIKSSQTLADGRAASGTFVLKKIHDDALSLQLIGHEIEGEPQPASEAVTVVRTKTSPDVDDRPSRVEPEGVR